MSWTPAETRQAFIYRHGTGLVSLGGGSAVAINNHGTVLGVTESLQPVFYQNGSVVPLNASIRPTDLNDSEVVVGMIPDPYGIGRAGVWSASTGLIDLNTVIPENSGWELAAAQDINNAGQILVHGWWNGVHRVARLDPVPEPSAVALLLAGVFGVTLLRRCRG